MSGTVPEVTSRPQHEEKHFCIPLKRNAAVGDDNKAAVMGWRRAWSYSTEPNEKHQPGHRTS